MQQEITLRIILTKPTPAVLFGLQRGAGNTYETIQKQMPTDNDLSFTFTITVKGDRVKDVFPKFAGPFVQGPAAGKFVYIDIGTCACQQDSIWSRRLKVPLSGITWQILDTRSNNTILQTVVSGTGKDGGPNCAMVKPFSSWYWQ